MRINPRLRSGINKVLVITVFYILINLFSALYNDSLITSSYVIGPAADYDGSVVWIINLLIGLLSGILGGSAMVAVNGNYFRKKSFNYAMRTTLFVYVSIFIIVLFFGSYISVLTIKGSSLTLNDYIEGLRLFALSEIALVYFIFWGAITLLTLFFLQINDRFGPGMFFKFLAGKYYQPREEDRIFMFLDLKSSTTIAEKIGNKKYFSLLKDVFADITNAILVSDGQIYQYVGDEVVISWDISKGVEDGNCVECFSRIKEKLKSRAEYYQLNYGIEPIFKAGLHHGEVTAGEIGSIKRDIVYSGDVLNTTSRIQEQCNFYKVDFLISTDTITLLRKELHYPVIPLGNIDLRGKSSLVELNTLDFAISA